MPPHNLQSQRESSGTLAFIAKRHYTRNLASCNCFDCFRFPRASEPSRKRRADTDCLRREQLARGPPVHAEQRSRKVVRFALKRRSFSASRRRCRVKPTHAQTHSRHLLCAPSPIRRNLCRSNAKRKLKLSFHREPPNFQASESSNSPLQHLRASQNLTNQIGQNIFEPYICLRTPRQHWSSFPVYIPCSRIQKAKIYYICYGADPLEEWHMLLFIIAIETTRRHTRRDCSPLASRCQNSTSPQAFRLRLLLFLAHLSQPVNFRLVSAHEFLLCQNCALLYSCSFRLSSTVASLSSFAF